MKDTHLVVAVSDLHAGSDFAICPPSGIALDDGSTKTQNRLQRGLWDWWKEVWGEYRGIKKHYRPASTTLFTVGDLTEGKHHGSVESAPLAGQHIDVAVAALRAGPLRFKWDKVHVIRGTESHVGKGAGLEEAVARALEAEGQPLVADPTTGTRTSYVRRTEVGGAIVMAFHHASAARLPHTRDAHIRHVAHRIWENHVRKNRRPPNLVLAGHHHILLDSGHVHDMPTRLVMLPGWKLADSYIHRVGGSYEIPEHGIAVAVIRDGAVVDVIKVIRQAEEVPLA